MLVLRQFHQILLVLIFICKRSVSVCPHKEKGLHKWSSPASWQITKKPILNDQVIIDKPVLLDESPPILHSINITETGRLVWSPSGNYELRLRYLLIYGRLDIGAEDCKFTAKANIQLLGSRGEEPPVTLPPAHGYTHSFGEKFIGVAPGGTLELHGEDKTSWTKLTQTVPKLSLSNGLIFDHQSSANQHHADSWKPGLAVYVFDENTGLPLDYKVFYTGGTDAWWSGFDPPRYVQHLDGIAAKRIVMIASNIDLYSSSVDMKSVYEATERLAFGKVNGLSLMRQVGDYEGYVLFVQKGNPSVTKENIALDKGNDGRLTDEVGHTFWNEDLKFSVQVFVHKTDSWSRWMKFRSLTIDGAYPKLTLLDDVSTWLPGDQVILASTDYDYKQAEECSVGPCTDCAGNQIRVNCEIEYMHWGEVIEGVDERGEVALLSRNIKIEGIMDDSCPPSNGNCARYPYDTFGGHLKVLKGFSNVHIEGTEFYNMGQQTEAGHYPIHFHMTLDVDSVGGYTNPAYVRKNSIHKSYARCLTIHGTHGLTVVDNVGYDHLGHCFFLEDGGEKRSVFDGNFGASTKLGSLIPSDSEPTTFWITNPQTTMNNNVAAGGEKVGIWYIFPEEPTGPSKGKGFMRPGEAKLTPIHPFENNVVHSYSRDGLRFDDEIQEDLTISDTNGYKPVANTSDPNSVAIKVIMSRFTGYKNRLGNAWIRGGEIELHKASLADASNAVIFARSSDTEQFLTDSIILGETANIGSNLRIWDSDLQEMVEVARSPALFWDRFFPVFGFGFYDGPVYVDNVYFNHFVDNDNHTASGIGFLLNNEFSSSPVSSVKNAMFGYDDGAFTGRRIFDGNVSIHGFGDLDGDLLATFRDVDGSVTGVPGSAVVRAYPIHVTAKCYKREQWNMAICPHKFGKLTIYPEKWSGTKPQNIVRRDDVPDQPMQLTGKNSNDYLVILGGSHSYTVHWKHSVPSKFSIHSMGFELNFSVRFGVCIPRDATFDLYSWSPNWRPNIGTWTQATSISELEQDTVGNSYYWDSTTGLLFFKFLNKHPRKEHEQKNCPEPSSACPMVTVTILTGNLKDMDCNMRAYGPYIRSPVDANGGLSDIPLIKTHSNGPPLSIGAWETKPFGSRQVIDGGFGKWTAWTSCSVTCGTGSQTRQRYCDSPLPLNGGTDCIGDNIESRDCVLSPCVVNGGWSDWSKWSSCTQVTDCQGYRTRKRSCNNPLPQHGGVFCAGYSEETQGCTIC